MQVIQITVDEFIKFKTEIYQKIDEIKESKPNPKLKWLRSKEVCQILGISLSSLQNLRNSGHLAFTKVRGTIFYKIEDVNALLEANYKKNLV